MSIENQDNQDVSLESGLENGKRREELQDLADDILAKAIKCDKSDLKNDVLISCLRDNVSLYKEYADGVNQNISLKKYFKKYTFKGKDYLIIPSIDKDKKKIHIKSFEIAQNNGKYSFVWNGFSDNMQESEETSRYTDLIPVNFPDDSAKNKFSTLYMNKWTWEILNVSPSEYKMDQQSVQSLMTTIEENWGSKLSDCSENLKSSVEGILGGNNDLDNQGKWFEEQRSKIVQCVMQWDFAWAVSGFIEIVKLFFNRKQGWRVINLWKWINYEWDERDIVYLESAISTVFDPEKRSELTYLLSKIKDKRMKNSLKEKWVENPSQFDLFLQHCEPGQIILTNWLDTEWKSSAFDYATQTASWARWCHAILVSDVIKDSNGIVTDAKIIQSTYKKWVHETTLKEYTSGKFSSADLLLANVPENSRENVVKEAKNRVGQKYDAVSIVTDSVLWTDVDESSQSEGIAWNFLWKNKAYCSELVFDAMKKSGCTLPEPHMSPSDLLLSEDVSPQYACYCDKF